MKPCRWFGMGEYWLGRSTRGASWDAGRFGIYLVEVIWVFTDVNIQWAVYIRFKLFVYSTVCMLYFNLKKTPWYVGAGMAPPSESIAHSAEPPLLSALEGPGVGGSSFSNRPPAACGLQMMWGSPTGGGKNPWPVSCSSRQWLPVLLNVMVGEGF